MVRALNVGGRRKLEKRIRELEAANERLKEQDRLKTRFVSDVSHELRNPVAVLKLYADLLLRGPSDRQSHYLAIIQEQAGRLARLIDDVLSLSRLEMGTAEPRLVKVEVNPLVAQIVDACQAEAEAARLALIFTPAADSPAVHGEPAQLAQVIANLIGNAIKFTPNGSVEVSIYTADPDVCLQVRDTGIGIEAGDLPYLFDRFYRGNTAVLLDLPGSGLGLSIVKRIVELHGGAIQVESEAGRGTTFTVRLPVWSGYPGSR